MLRAALETPRPDPREQALARTLGLPDLVARVLLARGIESPEQAKSFLRPDLGSLHDPFQFTHMQRAVDRVRDALRAGATMDNGVTEHTACPIHRGTKWIATQRFRTAQTDFEHA